MQREVVKQVQDSVQGIQLVRVENCYRVVWCVCEWEPDGEYFEFFSNVEDADRFFSGRNASGLLV